MVGVGRVFELLFRRLGGLDEWRGEGGVVAGLAELRCVVEWFILLLLFEPQFVSLVLLI